MKPYFQGAGHYKTFVDQVKKSKKNIVLSPQQILEIVDHAREEGKNMKEDVKQG
ncbi:hypothetical protein [Fictibacillus fluitans]|uniref:Uncharacterized protein n=1 Tax=Fictibacillus fluitans TaxID=3058422 RepID=A0ABT8HX61_9BACL|nr:hypothetical protein [Fictibacillus sp. NE201]MDN4525336.1 hypothetical protein [Fictibacillus sp. NE201]